jgi:hypothetical protein
MTNWYHIRSEWIGNLILTAAMLLFLSLYGCIGGLMGNMLGQDQNLTADQIKAYSDAGSKVYGCFVIAGPPPAGATTFIIVPKDAVVTFKFGDNCHLVQ